MRAPLVLVILAISLFSSSIGHASDRHEGYYYPAPEVIEEYEALAPILDGNSRSRRLNFIGGIVADIASKPYPPTYAMFAKGEHAEKLIIVGMRDGFYDTLYRTRALLAALTSLARTTPLFQDLDPEQNYTFFDLCYMLGFERLTVTNGKEFSHQIVFLPQTVNVKN